MRFAKLWLPAFVGLFISLAPASALPVPKLPPEVTNKPGVVVRVRPLSELLKDVAYVLKLTGQDGLYAAVEPAIQQILDVLDTQKPIGFYAKVGPAGIDSNGVLLVPVKNQNDFLNLLKTYGQNPTEADGLYTINLGGVPPVVFRFAGGYVYGTVKNTPDAEAGVSPSKIYPPEALFKQGDDSLLSVTLNVDALPNDLKRKSFDLLEEGLKHLREKEFPKEQNPVVRGFLGAAAEELAVKAQSFVVDTQTVTLRYDFDRTKEEMAFGVRLTPRPNTPLANDITTITSGKSLGAGIISPASAMNLSGNIAVSASLKKALEPVVDDFLAQGWKKAKEADQPFAKELIDILAPTIKAGVLDFGVDFRGPSAQKKLAFVACVQVQDANRLEGLLRKVHALLPPDQKAAIKLDVDQAGGIALHQFPHKDADLSSLLVFGPDPQGIVAFRKDAIVFGIGSAADAKAAVKSALGATAKTSPVIEGMTAMNKIAPVFEPNHPGMTAAAAKAYPAGVSDAFRLAVTGGPNLDVRFSTSTRLIQFGMLLEESRRK